MRIVASVSALALSVALAAACSDSNDDTPSSAGDTGLGADSGEQALDSGETPETATPVDSGPVSCTGVEAALVNRQNSVSTGAVYVTSDVDGVKTIYVDATAGGQQAAPTTPRVYVKLDTGTRDDITDVAAVTDTSWDLSLKRAVLYTNGGHGGSGQGGALFLAGVEFDGVTAANATGKTFPVEVFYDAQCTPNVDQIGSIATTFADWYDYSNTLLTPKSGTWLVKGGTGKLYKLAILNYYGAADGGTSGSSAQYTLKFKAL